MRVGMAADGPGARKWPVDGRRGSTGQSIARHVRRRPTPVSRPARRHPPAPPRTRPPARTRAAVRRPVHGWLRAVRESVNLTQARLAAKLGLTRQSYAALETSERHA